MLNTFIQIQLVIVSVIVLCVFSYAIKITCPEESFTLVASTPQEKVHLWFLQLLHTFWNFIQGVVENMNGSCKFRNKICIVKIVGLFFIYLFFLIKH